MKKLDNFQSKERFRGLITRLLIPILLIGWNTFDFSVHMNLNMVEPLRITGNIIGIIAALMVITGLLKKHQRLVIIIAVIAVIAVNAAHPILWGAELPVSVFIGTSLFLLIRLIQLKCNENVKHEGREMSQAWLKWWVALPAALIGLAIIFGIGQYIDSPIYQYMSLEQIDTTVDTAVPLASDSEEEVLSAFFGLDDALPREVNNWIQGAAGMDGMPVVFSTELDYESMQAGDFRITTKSGRIGFVHGVTLAPAIGEGELRTALIVGHFGSVEDPPELLEITGNLYSIDKTINYRGSSVEIIPLLEGPSLVYADIVPEENWYPGREAQRKDNLGTGTSLSGVKQVVRVAWAGGVKLPNGEQPGESELDFFKVTVEAVDGSLKEITPIAFADLGDGDNYTLLCLDTDERAISVTVQEGILVDPNEDLNPETTILIVF